LKAWELILSILKKGLLILNIADLTDWD